MRSLFDTAVLIIAVQQDAGAFNGASYSSSVLHKHIGFMVCIQAYQREQFFFGAPQNKAAGTPSGSLLIGPH